MQGCHVLYVWPAHSLSNGTFLLLHVSYTYVVGWHNTKQLKVTN